MLFMMSSASLASSGSAARPTQVYTMPWLSVLSNGTWGEQNIGVGDVWLSLVAGGGCSASGSTLRMKQNSELSSPASVLIWMHLEEKPTRHSQELWSPSIPGQHQQVGGRRRPGAEGSTVGADVVQAGLGWAGLLLPLAPVDDKPPLEV